MWLLSVFRIEASIFLDLCLLNSNCTNMATYQDYVIKKEYIMYVITNAYCIWATWSTDQTNFHIQNIIINRFRKIYNTPFNHMQSFAHNLNNIVIFRIYSKFVCTYINAICIAVAYKLLSENNYDAKIFAKIRNVWTS